MADPTPEANEPPPDPGADFTEEEEALLADMKGFTAGGDPTPCVCCSLAIVVVLAIVSYFVK